MTQSCQQFYYRMQAQKYENILNEQIQPSSFMNNRAKMTFLLDEKERLEIEISQLTQNNELLRRVNKELTKNCQHSSIVSLMSEQNQVLQKSYKRILKENQYLSSSLLMNQQIFDQHVLQHQHFIKDYEQKIIELRRAIQIKETNIQELQKRIKSEDNVVTPPTNVTLLFFNEIDQLKKTIDNLTFKNKFLEQQNAALKNQSQKLHKRLQLIEALTTKSKLMYDQFKQYYKADTQARKNSAPKKDTFIPFYYQPQSVNKKLNEGQSCVQTREFTEYTSRVDLPVKMVIYKQTLQILELKDNYKNLNNKLKVQVQLRQKIASSNSLLGNKLSSLVGELNYYKKCTQDLMQILSNKSCRGRSAEKLRRQQFLNEIKCPTEIVYITQRKKYWLDMQRTIKIDRFKLLHVKNKYKKVKRSFSCFKDYRSTEVDHIQKYLNKRPAKKRSMEQPPLQAIGDFSLFIDELGNGDISIIQTSEKQKGKTNYSQWKKATKNKNVLNLTILEENIL